MSYWHFNMTINLLFWVLCEIIRYEWKEVKIRFVQSVDCLRNRSIECFVVVVFVFLSIYAIFTSWIPNTLACNDGFFNCFSFKVCDSLIGCFSSLWSHLLIALIYGYLLRGIVRFIFLSKYYVPFNLARTSHYSFNPSRKGARKFLYSFEMNQIHPLLCSKILPTSLILLASK